MTKFLLHLAESEKNLLREIKKRLQHYCKFIKAFNISAAGLVTSYQCLSRGYWYLWRYRFSSWRGLSHREENDKKERESLLSFFSRCGSDRKMSVHFYLRTTYNRRPLFSRLNSGSLHTTACFFYLTHGINLTVPVFFSILGHHDLTSSVLFPYWILYREPYHI